MKRNQINVKMLKAYEEVININLFNEIISFIIGTTNVECDGFINKLQNRCIWYERSINNNIQKDYGFKYFGEILERFEQRIGNDIKDVRAIALSLGYSKEIITKEMITGTQVVDFINKIKKLSDNDIYLKAALYLYDEDKYYNLFLEIASQKFDYTEDIVFAFSLVYDAKQGFDNFENQLKELLGKAKTISVIENCGMYNWLIKTLYPIIKNNRSKGIELFKAIITMPTGFIKSDSKTYKILENNGYSKEEISFLNYICIFYSSIPKTVKIGNSMVEEKIAIEFCINILNSDNEYEEEIYDLLHTMFHEYYNFDIKCYGYARIKDAIIDSINIVNPKVFIKFFENFDRRIFSFDIMDSKWDIVKQEFTTREYLELFDELLVLNDFNKKDIESRILQYNKLTNIDYLSTFKTYMYGRSNIYSKLVAKGIISLSKQFEDYLSEQCKNIDDRKETGIEYLRDFVKGIQNKASFEFYKYILGSKKVTYIDLEKYNLGLNNLYENRRYYNSKGIDIQRKFLSKEETKEMLMWLENYIFFVEQENYIDFVISMLRDTYIASLISKSDLRKLYFEIGKIEQTIEKDEYLREQYLTTEELEMIKKQEIEEKKRERQLELEKEKAEVKEEFDSIENMTFEAIYNFFYQYRWDRKKNLFALDMVKKHFDTSLNNHELIKEEIIKFNEICNVLITKEIITINELKDYVARYIMKEETKLCKMY